MLHLPYWIDMSATSAPAWLLKYIMVARVLANGVAATIFAGDGPLWFAQLLAIISLGLYVLAFLIIRLYSKKGAPSIQPPLYALAHVSVTNFLFDTPGAGIRSVRISHTIVCWGSVVVVALLAIYRVGVQPLIDAWGCYNPAFVSSVEDYRFGTCDQPICTKPGIDCSRKSLTFETASWFAEQAFVVLFITQLLSVPAKVRYYQNLHTD